MVGGCREDARQGREWEGGLLVVVGYVGVCGGRVQQWLARRAGVSRRVFEKELYWSAW